MKLEIYSRGSKKFGLLCNVGVEEVELNGSFCEVNKKCLLLIESKKRTTNSQVIVISIRAKDFKQVRFKEVESILIKALGFSKKIRERIFRRGIKLVSKRGAVLKGIFPGSLNAQTIFFYRSLLKLLAEKCSNRKRIPHFYGKTATDQFVHWISIKSKRILSPEEYGYFKARLQRDIFNQAFILRKIVKDSKDGTTFNNFS